MRQKAQCGMEQRTEKMKCHQKQEVKFQASSNGNSVWQINKRKNFSGSLKEIPLMLMKQPKQFSKGPKRYQIKSETWGTETRLVVIWIWCDFIKLRERIRGKGDKIRGGESSPF